MLLTNDLTQLRRTKLIRQRSCFWQRLCLCGFVVKKVAHAYWDPVPSSLPNTCIPSARSNITRGTLTDEAQVCVCNGLVDGIPAVVERSAFAYIAMFSAQVGVYAIGL